MTTLTQAAPARADFHVISVIGIAHGTSHFYHLMLPALFPWLMKDFGLNFTEAGALMTVFFVVSGVGQALAGFVVDRFGADRVLFAGLGLLSLSGVALALAQNYPMLALAALIAGLGNSVFHPADFTLLNRRVSKPRLGHAFSVHGLSGNLGWAAAPALLATVAGIWNWRSAALVAAAVGAGVLALVITQPCALALEQQASGNRAAASQGGARPLLGFLTIPAVWLCFGFFFLVTFAFGILQNYSPPILRELYGLSMGASASALSAYLLGSAAGVVTGGFVVARGPRLERVITLALSTAASGW